MPIEISMPANDIRTIYRALAENANLVIYYTP
jgi:hypothetical protein